MSRKPPRGTRAGIEGVAYLPLLPASAVTHCLTATLRQAGVMDLSLAVILIPTRVTAGEPAQRGAVQKTGYT